jgi:hypothetical protein
MRDISILNEIWVQGKIPTYFDRLFAWLKYFTYRLVPVLIMKHFKGGGAQTIKVWEPLP